nr:ATP-binding protein [Ardenticatena sp.]
MDTCIVFLSTHPEDHLTGREAAHLMEMPFYTVTTPDDISETVPTLARGLLFYLWTDADTTTLTELRTRFPGFGLVVLDPTPSVTRARAAMRQGVFDYLSHPITRDEVVVALERWRQHLEVREEREHLSEILSLMELGRTITSTLNPQRLYEQTITIVQRTFFADTVSLMLLEEQPDGPHLIIVAQHGLPPAATATEVPLHGSIAGEVVRKGQPLILLGGLKGTPYEHLASDTIGRIGSAMSVPLKVRRRTLGVINVNRRSGRTPYTERDAQLLHVFAAQIAVAIQNARLYESVRQERDRILEAQETVRRELARDLHDGLTQLLSAITLSAENIRLLVEKSGLQSERLDIEIEYLRTTARQAVREARTLLFGLRPLILETRGLIATLDEFLQQMQMGDQEVTYHYIVSQAVPRTLNLPLSTVRELFAIVQEAVNNARKHAQAQNIRVHIDVHEGNRLDIVVEDDGIGFDLEAVRSQSNERYSFGLLNMQERAELIDAQLHIQSHPGEGTRVHIQLSLQDYQQPTPSS